MSANMYISKIIYEGNNLGLFIRIANTRQVSKSGYTLVENSRSKFVGEIGATNRNIENEKRIKILREFLIF